MTNSRQNRTSSIPERLVLQCPLPAGEPLAQASSLEGLGAPCPAWCGGDGTALSLFSGFPHLSQCAQTVLSAWYNRTQQDAYFGKVSEPYLWRVFNIGGESTMGVGIVPNCNFFTGTYQATGNNYLTSHPVIETSCGGRVGGHKVLNHIWAHWSYKSKRKKRKTNILAHLSSLSSVASCPSRNLSFPWIVSTCSYSKQCFKSSQGSFIPKCFPLLSLRWFCIVQELFQVWKTVRDLERWNHPEPCHSFVSPIHLFLIKKR